VSELHGKDISNVVVQCRQYSTKRIHKKNESHMFSVKQPPTIKNVPNVHVILRRNENSHSMSWRPVCVACSHGVVEKPRTSYHHLVTRLRKTDLQQVVPASLIYLLVSSCYHFDNNKLVTTCYTNKSQLVSLVGTTCSKSVTVINLVTRW
jgi:hypothetical protein